MQQGVKPAEVVTHFTDGLWRKFLWYCKRIMKEGRCNSDVASRLLHNSRAVSSEHNSESTRGMGSHFLQFHSLLHCKHMPRESMCAWRRTAHVQGTVVSYCYEVVVTMCPCKSQMMQEGASAFKGTLTGFLQRKYVQLLNQRCYLHCQCPTCPYPCDFLEWPVAVIPSPFHLQHFLKEMCRLVAF